MISYSTQSDKIKCVTEDILTEMKVVTEITPINE